MVLVFLNRMTNVKQKNEKCYVSQMFSNSLDGTQTFKTYQTASYNYCITVAEGNTKN